MHFQVKMPQNGRQNTLRDKKTIDMVPLMFSVNKVPTEM